MDDEIFKLLRRNRFTVLNVAPQDFGCKGIPEKTESVAVCGLGCDTKRTGRFPIAIGATLDDVVVKQALRHVIWCRNAQKRKATRLEGGADAQRSLGMKDSDRKKRLMWHLAVQILSDKKPTKGREQARRFNLACGGTYAQFMRIKYEYKKLSATKLF